MSWEKLKELPNGRVSNPRYPHLVYWEIRDGTVWHQRRKLRGANPADFEVRTDGHTFLARDGIHVFYAWSRLKAVHRDSFEVLDDGYFRDENLAYAEFETSIRPLKGRDREHFLVLGNGYARDSVHGYFYGKAIRGCCSPMTLALSCGCEAFYALDDDHIYFESAVLKGANRQEWRLLESGYSRDSERVYFGAKKLPRALVDSWEMLGGAYSRDARSVFVMALRLPGAQPATWRKLTGDYSTDGRRVYFVNRCLEGVDIESFEVTSGADDLEQTARDKHGSFRGSEREGAV